LCWKGADYDEQDETEDRRGMWTTLTRRPHAHSADIINQKDEPQLEDEPGVDRAST
jgi:hypothetical protein